MLCRDNVSERAWGSPRGSWGGSVHCWDPALTPASKAAPKLLPARRAECGELKLVSLCSRGAGAAPGAAAG